MSRVFLSHSSRDKTLVARLAEDLTAEGIGVWLDAWEILAGDSIAQAIQKGLEASDLVVLVLSRASVQSGWVDKEWQARIGREAASRAVHIIPVLAERCEIPALLADKRTADLSEDYDAGLGELLAAIRKHAGDDVEPRAAPARGRRSPYHARLMVSREDGAPVARWHAPDEGSEFPLALPLGAEDLEALRLLASSAGISQRSASTGMMCTARLVASRPMRACHSLSTQPDRTLARDNTRTMRSEASSPF